MSDTAYIASRKGFFTFTRGAGGAWTAGEPAFLGEPVSAILHDPRDGALYAALSLGHFGPKLHRSEDGGVTWNELSPPAFPKVEGDAEDAADGPSVSMVWTLSAGGRDQPGVLWAGVLPAALFRSDDRGESWSLVHSLWERPERERWFGGGFDQPGLHSILVDPRDSAKLTVAISCGGVWKSDDAAASWRQAGQGLRQDYAPPEQAFDPTTQDAHLIAACGAAPDAVWCQHHNGVFRSTDAADTFAEIDPVAPSAFGFAVAAHPHDPDTAWFAPGVKDECRVPVDARFVINRTRDGGETFEALHDGLPEGASYDLIYRHALAVDASGARLAVGSTTGNLWISESAGERWDHVHGHLPPIAAAAFAPR